MTKNDFGKYMAALRQFNYELDCLNSHLNAIAPGAVCEIGGHFLDSYTKLLTEATGDTNDWISWFVWNNEFGGDGLEAGYDGKLKKIKTVSDLWNLIEEGKNRD